MRVKRRQGHDDTLSLMRLHHEPRVPTLYGFGIETLILRAADPASPADSPTPRLS